MGKRVFKIISALSFTFILMFSLAACGSNGDKKTSLEKIKARGTLVVGLSAATPPYEFHYSNNGKNEIKGADLELVKRIAKQMDVKYEIKDMDFDGLLPALQSGKIDMIVSAMSPTPEREKAADFSKVYYKSTNVFVVRKSELSKYAKPSALKNATVATINSSTQQAVTQKYFPKAHLKLLGKSNDLALAVAHNKADAMLVDVPTAELLIRANPSLAQTNLKYNDDTAGAAIAMPNHSSKDFKDAVNTAITKYKGQYEKWIIEQVKYVKE
ncbi:transporter substrate-binding domain-containing protein [Sporolactobacillus terrae]|uniref:Amino acid ABC transporter n=1 Tax=Sporolactobacillus terrae TaxID=269673 RepID=A0A410D6D6_9BACL|nr:transporter substrate-binding domain-containing protein [Sporolactobacillus terrae]QAA24613.1 amino acid ABC transporter substrate-binding protein [Sporolactobacillus terrae]UAK16450.1 transporter substrate-binding domain-containing protein [Sporolactobacillus terrae]BBN97903.1 amino acid ABC transporter [Sporolactobacillus terrae]